METLRLGKTFKTFPGGRISLPWDALLVQRYPLENLNIVYMGTGGLKVIQSLVTVRKDF